MPKQQKKADLFELITEVKENFDELRAAAADKQDELQDLRTTLWEILGPPPGTVTDGVTLDACSLCSPKTCTMMARVADSLKLIRKNMDDNAPNNARGRVNSTLVMIGSEVVT